MARRRGGLAGIWDRNKKFIKPIATVGAGLLTGGAGGALVGGLMNGLDREGKGGIGFDLGKGAMGAVTGYGAGKLGGALKSGVMSRLGAGGAEQVLANNPMGAAAIRGIPQAAMNTAQSGPSALSRVASMTGNFLKDGKNLAAVGQTALGAAGAMSDRERMRMEREEMDRRRRMEDEEIERRRGMDPMRAQLMQALMQRFGAGMAA
jgi:hypothetical protein